MTENVGADLLYALGVDRIIFLRKGKSIAAKAGVGAEDPGTYLAAKRSMINILEYIRDVQRLRLDNII